jgi:hypothetical protein
MIAIDSSVFHRQGRWRRMLAIVALAVVIAACDEALPAAPSGDSGGPSIRTNEALFAQVTVAEPFQQYVPFPNLVTDADRVLPASSAHRPNVRVSMNEKAFAALQNGRLPSGGVFPEGSIIFKEVIDPGGNVSLFAVMYKERLNPFAREGWLWAELRPSGGAAYSVTNGGSGCIACHSLDDGPKNDHVRIFERQR